MLINIETFILFPQKFLLGELINNAFLPLPGFGSRWQKESKCWCKYSGIATVKLNIKHWLSLMAQVTCWAKNCIIGSSTKIGQVLRFPVTTAMIKLIAAYRPKGCIAIELIELQICLNLSLIMVLWHTHIYICRLVPLYRIEFWSRPTHMQFFKLLTCKISERSCFFI